MFLDDSDAHPRVKERMDLTERLIAGNAAASYRLETRGQTAIERVISLVLLGDLVSIYLAALRGVDPGPVKVIDELKDALAALSGAMLRPQSLAYRSRETLRLRLASPFRPARHAGRVGNQNLASLAQRTARGWELKAALAER